jgi:Protein of unknown function (DUF4012)
VHRTEATRAKSPEAGAAPAAGAPDGAIAVQVTRRRSRRWPVAVLLLVLLAGGAAGLGYHQAQGLQREAVTAFGSGQAHLERAKTLLAKATADRDMAAIDQARQEFRAAASEFRRAGAVVGDTPLARIDPRVPYVGSRVAAVGDLSAMGVAVSDAGLRSADIDTLFLEPPKPGQPTGTARLLGILDQVQATLPPIQRDLDRARASAAAVVPEALPASERPALQKARDAIAKAAQGIAEFDRLFPAVRDILAVDGRRTYVVEQANPFELRFGGGYIGTYSLVVADHGNLTVQRSGDTHDLPDFSTTMGQAAYVAPPPPMQGLLQRKSWSFQDSNFYPDFADDAKAAAQFAQRDFGTGVDGVISVDLYAVAAMLAVTGPIDVPGFGVRLDKDNFVPTVAARDLVDDPTHKRLLSSVAGPLMQRVVSLGSDRWPQLIQVLNDEASQRHIQMAFFSDRSQPEMERLGLAGQLAFTGHDDFLYLAESNVGGNKANYFLTRRLTLALSRSGGLLHHELTEDLTLDLGRAPAGYEVPYSAYFRLLVPGAATGTGVSGIAADGQPYMTMPAGVRLIGGSRVLVPAPATRRADLQVRYTWDTPWTQDPAAAHRVYWQKQPGTAYDAIRVTWSADRRAPAAATSDLGGDRLVTVTAAGALTVAQGQGAQVALPKLSL